MRGFALTTSIVPNTPYFEAIWPITEPLFVAYAEKWEMDWLPHFATDEELLGFRQGEHSTSPAPRGTEAVYCGIPHRRRLLDSHSGVVFLDSDAVIMDDTYDICREVDENLPIAAGGNFNGAVVIMRSHEWSKRFLDLVMEGKELYKRYQWLEQAAMMELVGYDGRYPGDNMSSGWRGDTEWTPRWNRLGGRWNASPFHPQEVRPLIFHPGGVQPFARRLEMVREAAEGRLPAPWRNDLPRV